MNKSEFEKRIAELTAQLEQQKFDYFQSMGFTKGQIATYKEVLESLNKAEKEE